MTQFLISINLTTSFSNSTTLLLFIYRISCLIRLIKVALAFAEPSTLTLKQPKDEQFHPTHITSLLAPFVGSDPFALEQKSISLTMAIKNRRETYQPLLYSSMSKASNNKLKK